MQICERQTNKVEKERDRVSISLGKFPGAKMIKRWPWQYTYLVVNTRYGFASNRVICRLKTDEFSVLMKPQLHTAKK